jgi:alpha-ketoglutarate-dependent taurine dioxygenase
MNMTIDATRRLRRGRKTVRMDSAQLVTYEPLVPNQTLPIVCRPAVQDISATDWIPAQKAQIEQLLLRHGAMLLRGFPIHTVDDFNACVKAVSGGAVEYVFRASPRTRIDERFHIYTSTDYPAPEKIFPHNEHAYSPVFPLRLYFYCHTASTTGGETPIGSTRFVLENIPADLRERFREKRIMYVRNYGDGMGLPWQTVFQTTSRSQVEEYCRGVGITTEWKSDDRLRTRQIGPAILAHPLTREPVWFNHATFFNALTLPRQARDGLLGHWLPEDFPQNTFYGDGSVIETDVIYRLQRIYLDSLVEFSWQPGDVLLLDNMLTVHARNAFSGPRRIMTAMSEPQRSADLAV